MKMKKSLARAFAASLMFIAFAGSASAADMAVKAMPVVPPVPLYNWTGFYVGGNVGYGWGNQSVALGPTNNAASIAFFGTTFPTLIPNSVSPDPKGVIGGGQVGYNWQTSRFVLGVEADLQGADVKGTVNTFVAPIVPIASSTSQKLEWFGTVRGRAGFVATANNALLLYVTGGLAYGSVNHFFAANNGTSFNTTNVSNTYAGWTAGVGLEWGFAPQWSVKGEYLYVDLGSRTFATVGTGATPAGASIDSTFRDRFHIARVGVNYHFGGPVVAKY